MGLRVRQRSPRVRAAVCRRRTRVRRQRERDRLRARRVHGLHALVVQGRRARPNRDVGRRHAASRARQRRGRVYLELRVLRRSERLRLRGRRRHRRAALEGPRRRARGRDHHWRAEVPRGTALRAGLFRRRRRGRQSQIRVLHVPGQRRLVRCAHRPEDLADVPRRRAETDGQDEDGNSHAGTVRRRRVVVADRGRRARRPLRRDGRQLLVARFRDERRRRRHGPRHGPDSLAQPADVERRLDRRVRGRRQVELPGRRGTRLRLRGDAGAREACRERQSA